MRVYLAGPMRGLPDWNFPAFDEAERRWRDKGHIAFSPASIDRALGYGANTDSGIDSSHLRHVIMSDVTCLMHADAIAMLPGWESSMGATVELALAQFLSLPVYNAVTMERLRLPDKPWSTDTAFQMLLNAGYLEQVKPG